MSNVYKEKNSHPKDSCLTIQCTVMQDLHPWHHRIIMLHGTTLYITKFWKENHALCSE